MNTIQTAKVVAVRGLGENAFVLKVERSGFEFTPGQCVNIGLVGSAVNREYSTYSGVDEPFLEFLVRRIDGGAVSPKLAVLKAGEPVTLDGAYGLFTIEKPKEKNRNYVFIATGTGIAPFHSYAKSYPELNYKIIHGIRLASEEYDRNDYPADRYFPCLSREKGIGFSGRVSDYLRVNRPDPKSLYYLCGNSSMINEVYDILRNADISGSQIFTEVFF